ncbi:High frequency lysogenization protein HflD [Raoultella terrigena]|uniref:High frequency lysogenization protein HflD n=1 Tax=Raoultella terrigena TaxID=577 RepID=A0A3P8M422_RAOTE|nr:High frequency lysogenization protein HflD [Raoultella terrigena]
MTSRWRWLAFCQAARLVQQLAHQGHCDSDALHVSLNSIIDLNPDSTLAVFGGSEANLRLGLETLLAVLNTGSRQGLNAELTRYTLSMMCLNVSLRQPKAHGYPWQPHRRPAPPAGTFRSAV